VAGRSIANKRLLRALSLILTMGVTMESIRPIDLLGMFARIIDLREGEELVQVYSAYQIKAEEIFKDIHLPIMGPPLEAEFIDIYSSIWEGFLEGALALTNRRLVFLRRIMKQRKTAPHKTHRYEIEEAVELEDLARIRAKEDLLEIICNPMEDPRVLHFTSFNKMGLKDTGLEPMPKMMSVSADEVVDEIAKVLPLPPTGEDEGKMFFPSSMSLNECVEKRSSIRKYKPDKVPEYVIMEALRIGNQAPSAGNVQARDFIIVTERETKKELVDAAFGQKFLLTAPVIIVCCANLSKIETHYQERGRELYALQDVAASVSYIELYLVSKDYSSCWVGCFDESKVSEILRLPNDVRPVVLLTVGKPERGKRPKPERIDTRHLTHNEKW
jgi:nitroreductase